MLCKCRWLFGVQLERLDRRLRHDFTLSSQQFHVDAAVGCGSRVVDGIDVHLQGRVPILAVEIGVHEEISHVLVGGRPEKYIAEDAAQTPEVLVLEVAAVAVAVHLHGDVVGTWPHVLRDIEQRRCAAILAVTNLLAVDPHVVCRIDTVKLQEHLALLPARRQLERAAVTSHGVALCIRRVVAWRFTHDPRRVFLERIRDVRVQGNVVALSLPVARNGHFMPAGHVEVVAIEIGWSLVGIWGPMKLPGTVERLEPRVCGTLASHGRFLVGVNRRRDTRCFLVASEHLFVLPIRRLSGTLGGKQESHAPTPSIRPVGSTNLRMTIDLSTGILGLGASQRHGVTLPAIAA